MAEKSVNWVWKLLRRRSQGELDRMEQSLVKGSSERREFVGDPNQDPRMRIRTRFRRRGKRPERE